MDLGHHLTDQNGDGDFHSKQQQQDHTQLAALELRISQLEQQLHASTGTENAKSAQQGEEQLDCLIIMTYAAFAYGCFVGLFNIPVK